MPEPNEDAYAREVIRTVSDLVRKTDALETTVAQSVRHADEERDKLLASVNATIEQKWSESIGSVEAMRKDVFRAIVSLQLNASQHRDEHSAERNERAAAIGTEVAARSTDAIDRINRQLTVNLWMGALTALVVLNLLLIGFVVVRVAVVMYAR